MNYVNQPKREGQLLETLRAIIWRSWLKLVVDTYRRMTFHTKKLLSKRKKKNEKGNDGFGRVLWMRKFINNNMRWIIGNGENISYWNRNCISK